jgi:hypothetical protein
MVSLVRCCVVSPISCYPSDRSQRWFCSLRRRTMELHDASTLTFSTIPLMHYSLPHCSPKVIFVDSTTCANLGSCTHIQIRLVCFYSSVPRFISDTSALARSVEAISMRSLGHRNVVPACHHCAYLRRSPDVHRLVGKP